MPNKIKLNDSFLSLACFEITIYIYTHYILNVLHFLRSSISLSLSFCLLHALRPVPHQSTNGPSKVQQHWGALEDYLEHRLGKTHGKLEKQKKKKKQIKHSNTPKTYHYLPLPTITYHLILPPYQFSYQFSISFSYSFSPSNFSGNYRHLPTMK